LILKGTLFIQLDQLNGEQLNNKILQKVIPFVKTTKLIPNFKITLFFKYKLIDYLCFAEYLNYVEETNKMLKKAKRNTPKGILPFYIKEIQ